MKHYLSEVRDVLESVDATQDGLKSAEAGERLQKNGPNKLREPKKVSLFVRFLKQLADPMIIILIVAAAVSAVIAVLEKESFADVIIIVAVVLINAVLGVVQESKAEKAIAALQEMTAATSKVLRDGNNSARSRRLCSCGLADYRIGKSENRRSSPYGRICPRKQNRCGSQYA